MILLLQKDDISEHQEATKCSGTDIMHKSGTAMHKSGTAMHKSGTAMHKRGTAMHKSGTSMHKSGTDLTHMHTCVYIQYK